LICVVLRIQTTKQQQSLIALCAIIVSFQRSCTLSNLFILFHPFSSFFFEKGRKRQKKAGKGYQVSFPSENLKPVVVEGIPLTSKNALLDKKCLTKKNLFFVCIFCFKNLFFFLHFLFVSWKGYPSLQILFLKGGVSLPRHKVFQRFSGGKLTKT